DVLGHFSWAAATFLAANEGTVQQFSSYYHVKRSKNFPTNQPSMCSKNDAFWGNQRERQLLQQLGQTDGKLDHGQLQRFHELQKGGSKEGVVLGWVGSIRPFGQRVCSSRGVHTGGQQ
ncbi:hypothetical protein ACLOJK_029232, partial [Asimina triloba]